MIAANELRIGNWLHYKIDEMQPSGFRLINDKFIQVDSINYDHLLKSELPDSYCINHGNRNYYYPIPLTPEILEKCGFKFRNQNYVTWYYKPLMGFASTMKIFVHDDFYFFNPYEWNFQREIKSLHQLQNLYYALTGEELTLSL